MNEYKFELRDNLTITRDDNEGDWQTVLHFDRGGESLSIVLAGNVYVSDLLRKITEAWVVTDID